MDVLRLRQFARVSLGIGATVLIVGGVMIALGKEDFGDLLMVVCGALFMVGALALTRTPTGDSDAG